MNIAPFMSSPPTIGRYKPTRELGRGAQGVVWLAQDPTLERQVAIKTLARHSPEAHSRLLSEARIVSRLQHASIVQLFDVIDSTPQVALVFEYVSGESLDKTLQRSGAVPVARAVELTLQVLEGLAAAHAQGVIHRDIKPANIIVDSAGKARITDFGLATRVEEEARELAGSGSYIAPEYLRGEAGGVNADVFSVGALLYTLLTGTPPVEGNNLMAVLYKLAHEPIAPPSSKAPAVDQKLDDIVQKALFKQQGDRFASASDMHAALKRWQGGDDKDGNDSAESSQATLDFLLRRMRHTNDFPALSQSISSINKIAGNDQDSLQKLSTAILKDFALTNKLLRMVNSATFGQFSGRISTISRAVMILGFNTIRNLAVTLMLVEHMQNRNQAGHMREEVLASFMVGQLGKRLAAKSGHKDAEEGFICAMFYNLGRLLVAYYFHEESLEIKKKLQKGEKEDPAAHAVLGVSYRDIGQAVSKAWNLPAQITSSMKRLDDEVVRTPRVDEERLRLISNMANDLFEAISGPADERSKQLEVIHARYRDAAPLTAKQMQELAKEALTELVAEAPYFGLQAGRSELLTKIRQSVSDNSEMGSTAGANATGPDDASTSAERLTMTAPLSGELEAEEPETNQGTLTAGIQDITNTLVDNFNLNDLFRMVLETIYRGMKFDRVVLFLRDLQQPRLVARFGFGQQIDQVTHKVAIPLARSEDVFHLACVKYSDIFIENVNTESIKNHVPPWYRQSLAGETFLLLPLVVDKKLIGLLYADMRHSGQLVITPKELSLLKTLRNQLVLGIRQKQMG